MSKQPRVTPQRSSAGRAADGEGKKKPAAPVKAAKADGGGSGDDGSGGGGDDDSKKKKPGADGGAGDDGSGDDSKKKKPAAAAGDGEGGDGDDGGGGGGGDDDDSGGGDDGSGGDDGDWRVRMAGGDKVLLARLQRFAAEGDVGRSLLAAEKKAREKGGIQLPAADAPLEERAKFYTQHFGRPENVEDIELQPSLPDGEELQEPEVQLLQSVAGRLHQAGIFGNDQIQAAAQLVTDMIVGGRQELTKKVTDSRKVARQQLAKAWGESNVEANLEYANNYAAMRCEQVGVDPKALATLRLEDGSLLGDNPLWAQIMAAGGRDHAEDPGMLHEKVEGGVGDLQKQLNTEMAKMNSKDAKERKFYGSEEGKALRNRLRSAIKRAGGGGKKAAATKK